MCDRGHGASVDRDFLEMRWRRHLGYEEKNHFIRRDVGVQALEAIAAHPEQFELVGFAFGKNIEKARDYARFFA